MRTVRPTFTELVDWLDGRLGTGEAEAVASFVAEGDPLTLESVEWILAFVDGASSMPLEQPPPELGGRLRGIFDRLHGAHRDRDWSDATLLYDARSGGAPSGEPSRAGRGVHRAFESELGRFVLDATTTGRGEVDVEGLVLLPADSWGVDLAFLASGTLRRALHSARDGRFRARGLPVEVDELWLTSGSTRVRAVLDLRL